MPEESAVSVYALRRLLLLATVLFWAFVLYTVFS